MQCAGLCSGTTLGSVRSSSATALDTSLPLPIGLLQGGREAQAFGVWVHGVQQPALSSCQWADPALMAAHLAMLGVLSRLAEAPLGLSSPQGWPTKLVARDIL